MMWNGSDPTSKSMDETAYIDMEGVQGIPALSPTHALIGIALSQKEFGTMDYSLSQLCDL